MSKYTDYKNKFNEKNYDRLYIVVPKGKKEIIKNHSEKTSESLNSFINRAIDETMESDIKQKKDTN